MEGSMAGEATFGLSRIRQIALVVHDLPAATVFYRDTLGMKFLFEVPGQLAFFDCSGIWIMLSPPEGEFSQSGSFIYFEVEDIHAAHRTLTERGVDFIDAPHRIADMGTYELWMSFFRDLDRNPLALRAEIKK
jgi:catechol 2,3-dioxygenase-like lactoylglutathione lyase family enzyme